MKTTKEDCEKFCEPAWKGYIRPAGFVITLTIFFLLIFIDGNVGNFHVREAYLPILETVLVTIVVAFFGSRGVEKTARTLSSKPNTKINTEEPPAIYKKYQKDANDS